MNKQTPFRMLKTATENNALQLQLAHNRPDIPEFHEFISNEAQIST
jgi:hypothetical protein